MKIPRQKLSRELKENIIPFWIEHSIDTECGGYLTCLERDGQPYDTEKQLWMQWREVYMFAALFNRLSPKDEYLKNALWGYDFLYRYGRREDGGYHYLLDRQGRALSDYADGAEIFTGSFVAIACAELYRATGETRFAKEAFHALDYYHNAIAANSKPITDEMPVWSHLAHPMIELNVLQTMRNAFGNHVSDQQISNCIAEIFTYQHPEYGVFMENRLIDGSFDLSCQTGRFTNPGHPLEGLSFIMEEIRLRKGKDDTFVETYLTRSLDAVKKGFKYGWDAEQGGIWYFKDILGKPVAKHECMLKAWWPQNEAATAALRAYELSKDTDFLEMFQQIEDYSWKHHRDPEYPEWFAYTAVDGRQIHSYKGSRFKGFFHIPRHLLDCMEICSRLSAGK